MALGRNSLTHSRNSRCFVSDIRVAFRPWWQQSRRTLEMPQPGSHDLSARAIDALVVLGNCTPKENVAPPACSYLPQGVVGVMAIFRQLWDEDSERPVTFVPSFAPLGISQEGS